MPYSYILSLIGATFLQSRPLKCFAWLAVRKEKDYCLTDRLVDTQHTDSPVNYFYPLHVSFSCWCVQLVLSQGTGKHEERPPSYNRSTVLLNFHQSCSTVGATTDLHAPLRWRSSAAACQECILFWTQLLDLTRASINVEAWALTC